MEHLIYLISISLNACRKSSPQVPNAIDAFRNQPTLSPFDIPLIFEQILSYLDRVTVRSCQVVCKRWYEYAAPVSWHRTIQDDSFNGHSPEHWKLLQVNLHHINTLTWILSANDKLREERISQFAIALSRRRASMRTLTLQGSYNLENDLRAVLPYVPYLHQLNLQTHWTQPLDKSTPISLESIFENATQLKTLQLRDNISLTFSRNELSSTNGSTTSLSPQLNESLACRNARGLVSLDVVDVRLSAQQLLDLSEYFPNLQTLKFDISPISISMEQYRSTKLVNAVQPSPSHTSNSQAFARDIAMSWPKLCDISIRHNGDFPKSNRIEATRLHTRDIVAELTPRLRSLDIWADLLHYELLDCLTNGACMLKKFVSIPRTHINDGIIPHDAFIHFLRNCSTLEVVDIGFPLNLNLFDCSASLQNLTPPPTPKLSIPSTSYLTTLWQQQLWACNNLKYLDLSLTYPQATHKSYSREEFRLCDNLYKQLARLTRLRILSIKGTYYIPNDLKNSGFYQLAALKELRVISVCLFQDEDCVSDCEFTVAGDGRTRASSEGGVVGFLHRKDLEWMVKQWPSIKLLEFRGSFHNDDELKKAQYWVNEATGRSGRITLSDGRNSFISSVRESLGLE